MNVLLKTIIPSLVKIKDLKQVDQIFSTHVHEIIKNLVLLSNKLKDDAVDGRQARVESMIDLVNTIRPAIQALIKANKGLDYIPITLQPASSGECRI